MTDLANESSAYQLFFEEGFAKGVLQAWAEGWLEGWLEGRLEGRLEEIKVVLLLLGAKRFGALDDVDVTELQAIADLDRLERMAERILEVQNWQDLLATP